MQADAAQLNASVIVAAKNVMSNLTATIDQAWNVTLETIDPDLVKFDQLLDFLGTAVRTDSLGLGSVPVRVTGLVDNPFTEFNPVDHPMILSGQVFPPPDELIPSNVDDSLAAASGPLSLLIDPDIA